MSDLTDFITNKAIGNLLKFKPFTDTWALGYRTKGGSFMLSTTGAQDDDGKPNDLIIVSAYGDVTALKPTLNPDYLEGVRELFQGAPASQQAQQRKVSRHNRMLESLAAAGVVPGGRMHGAIMAILAEAEVR